MSLNAIEKKGVGKKEKKTLHAQRRKRKKLTRSRESSSK
jgi:hypothetical protein